LQEATFTQEPVYHENTSHAFTTVYTLEKLKRPFSDLPVLLDMQTMFGLDMRREFFSLVIHVQIL
jgi:hypothetical protein